MLSHFDCSVLMLFDDSKFLEKLKHDYFWKGRLEWFWLAEFFDEDSFFFA